MPVVRSALITVYWMCFELRPQSCIDLSTYEWRQSKVR